VLFEVEDDQRFEREGEDLYTEILCTYPQMALGADVEVPAVTGTLSLRVPAGTQSGQLFTLRGRGLPRVNASGVGDLHVRVQLWTPTEIAGEEKRLIEQLNVLRPTVQQPRNKSFWSKMKDALGA
jgi:molecular chaperone DnaJ